MKKITTLILAAVLLAVAGCATNNGGTPRDPVKVEQVKAAVTPLVSSGIRRVLTENPNLEPYFVQVQGVFETIRDTGQFDPSFLVAQLNLIPLEDEIAIDVKNLLVALYTIYYADRARIEVGSFADVADVFARGIAQAIVDFHAIPR